MAERSKEEIIENIKHLIEKNVKPAVASHGGNIEFLTYDNGHLVVELGGASSGSAGSTITLKMGVENMIKHYVPEVHTVEAQDDPFSNVDPFYTDPTIFDHWDTMPNDEGNNDPTN